MKFISLCSGIEAASVAFNPLGWEAICFAEIEPFPSSLLQERFPHVPNMGDMSRYDEWPEEFFADADMIVGGPPCQSFSIAGGRRGLDDDRGNLTLTFTELIDHADRIRRKHNRPPVIILYENVPGLLSDKTNAFGCLLGALAGEDDQLNPSGQRWTNAGAVLGPERSIAWRILDAQYFGLAQRRKRVFVIASARAGFSPSEILFEYDGVRRDIAPSREQGQETTGNAGASFTASSFRKLTFESYAQDETASTMMARDYKSYTDLVAYSFDALGSNSMKSANPHSGCREVNLAKTLDTTIPCPSKNQGGIGIVSEAYGIPGNWIGRKPQNGGNSTQFMHEVAPAQTATDRHGVVAIQGSVIGRKPENGPQGSGYDDTGVCFTQTAVDRHAVAIAGTQNDAFRDATDNLAPTLRSGSGGGAVNQAVATQSSVRRLTPKEAERLQGFPDGWTQITWRNKPAEECPDGHRYKALGNSWAVPVVHWIGQRIANFLDDTEITW